MVKQEVPSVDVHLLHLDSEFVLNTLTLECLFAKSPRTQIHFSMKKKGQDVL